MNTPTELTLCSRFLFKRLLFVLVCFGCSSCAIGPLTNGGTARSLGRGHYRIDSTLVNYLESGNSSVVQTPVIRLTYGLTPSWDLGIQTELNTFTINSKHNFIDSGKNTGISLAALLGIALGGSELSYSAGGIVSYLFSSSEPYMVLRYNLVNFDQELYNSAFFESPPDLHFSFVSANIGYLYWWTQSVALGGEIILWSPQSFPAKPHSMVSVQISFVF